MPETKIFDEGIWDAFRGGDKKSYAVIYRYYYPRIYNYGMKFTSDNALVEDCSQEIFTAFWHNRGRLENVQKMQSYLFVSFRNCLLRAIRKSNQMTAFYGEEQPFYAAISVEQLMINAEKMYEHRVNLDKALELLTERQKEAIFFKFYENMTYEEIAHVLDISVKATYKLVTRAVAVLRTSYQQKISSIF
ncbi:MAG TPA: sigma-70 family RNA polymerase sigma factor [Flavitalea sp.]|nr:sigma-70 family RNA polymerase sigma factor [Flavitalea sp.]